MVFLKNDRYRNNVYVPNKVWFGKYRESVWLPPIPGRNTMQENMELMVPSCRLFLKDWCNKAKFRSDVRFSPWEMKDKEKEIMKTLSGNIIDVENEYVTGFSFHEFDTYSGDAGAIVNDPRGFKVIVPLKYMKFLMDKCVENGVYKDGIRYGFSNNGEILLLTKEIEENLGDIILTEDEMTNRKNATTFVSRNDLVPGKVYDLLQKGFDDDPVRCVYLGYVNFWNNISTLREFYDHTFVRDSLREEYSLGKKGGFWEKILEERYKSGSYGSRLSYSSYSLCIHPWETRKWGMIYDNLKSDNNHVFLKLVDTYDPSYGYEITSWVDHYMDDSHNDFAFSWLKNLVVMKSVGKKIKCVSDCQKIGLLDSYKAKENHFRLDVNPGNTFKNEILDRKGYSFKELESAFFRWIDNVEQDILKYYTLFPKDKPKDPDWLRIVDNDPYNTRYTVFKGK